ncbi:hypothetical protein ACFZDK_36910 [Streptomyces sp. NPDC007901]|uniref:hypothetical protein n=1 Tax=Streptomyces sp. NPDC007901 TaxID=3364785 RepID=UPI0036E23A8D
MQGQGHAQPVQRPPHDAVLVLLRVVFVALGVFSAGFLAWAMMLRLAVVTRRSVDFGLLVTVMAADILSVVLLASEPGEEVHTPGGYLGITLLFGGLLATVVYYLAADVRHFQRRREAYAAQAYGYPPPASPYTTTTTPLGVQAPHTPPPHTVPPVSRPPLAQPQLAQPPIPAPPQRPAPARIEQVRAELDELSDYLRKHDGRDEGGR